MAIAIAKLVKPGRPIKIFDPLPANCPRHKRLIGGGGDLRTCIYGCMFVRDPAGRGWIYAKNRIKREGS